MMSFHPSLTDSSIDITLLSTLSSRYVTDYIMECWRSMTCLYLASQLGSWETNVCPRHVVIRLIRKRATWVYSISYRSLSKHSTSVSRMSASSISSFIPTVCTISWMKSWWGEWCWKQTFMPSFSPLRIKAKCTKTLSPGQTRPNQLRIYNNDWVAIPPSGNTIGKLVLRLRLVERLIPQSLS